MPTPPPMHNYMPPTPTRRREPSLFEDLLGADVEGLCELLDDPLLGEAERSVVSRLQRGADPRQLSQEDQALLDGMVMQVAEGSVRRPPAPVVGHSGLRGLEHPARSAEGLSAEVDPTPYEPEWK